MTLRGSTLSLGILAVSLAFAPALAARETTTVPIKLAATWRGAACNPSGAIDVVLTNISSRSIAVPKDAVVPVLFAAEIRSSETEVIKGKTYDIIYGSYGHPFLFHIYPTDYERNDGMKVLKPGEATTYPIALFDAHTRDLETIPPWMTDDFEIRWRNLLRDGGGVSIRYVLRRWAGFRTKNVYYVSSHRKPEILSNELTCAGQNSGASPN